MRADKDQDLVLTDYFGKNLLTKEDTEKILDRYYEEKGWGVEKGIPTQQKRIELGLEDMTG